MSIKPLKTKKVISFLHDIQSSPILAITAELASRSQKWKLAAKKWKSFIEKSDKSAPLRAYLRLVEANVKLHNHFYVLDTLNKASLSYPHNKKILGLYKKACSTITRQIKNDIKSQNLKGPTVKLERLNKYFPESPSKKTYITLAEIYFKLSLHAEAKKIVEDGLLKYPDEVGLHIQLAKLFQAEKDWPKAIFYLKKALEFESSHYATALQQLAQIYEKTESFNAAEKILRKGISQFPKNLSFKINLAKLLLKRSAEDELYVLYQSFEKLEYECITVRQYLDISKFFINKGEFQKAEEVLTKALDVYPNSLKIINLKAQVSFKIKNYKMAAKQLDLIGHIYVKKRKWKNAIYYFNLAATLEQTNIHPPLIDEINLDNRTKDLSSITLNENHTIYPIRTYGLWRSYSKLRDWEKMLDLILSSSDSHIPSPKQDKLFISVLHQVSLKNRLKKPKLGGIFHPMEVDQLIYENLSEALKTESKFKLDTAYLWLGLYFLFFICGYLKSAYLAKKVAAKCGLNHSYTNDQNEINSLMKLHSLAYLKCEETSEYAKYIINNSNRPTDRIKAIKVLLSLQNLSKKDNKYFTNQLFQESLKYYPEEFLNLIQGKSIAIVGPADNGLLSGNEIDDFDIIIRPNAISINHDLEFKKKFGSRTDITYFTKGSERRHRSELQGNLNVLNFKYLVLKRSFREKHIQFYQRNTPTRCITPQVTNRLYSPFAIPRIVSDIRPLKPKKIKIFGVDFYTGQNFYNPHYISKENPSMFERLLYGLAHHDLLYNFTEAKKWMRFTDMDFDDKLKQILQLTEDQYLNIVSKNISARLEKTYSIDYNGPIVNRFKKNIIENKLQVINDYQNLQPTDTYNSCTEV